MADDTKKTENVKVEEPKGEVKEEKKEVKKVAGNVGKLVDEIAKLTVVELSELVSALQDKLGVSAVPTAQAPAGLAPAGGETPQAGGESAGSGVQSVTMTGSGTNKIGAIKALREINPNLTLMDAKNMTEQLPAEVLKDAKSEDVRAAVEKLKAVGATVEVK